MHRNNTLRLGACLIAIISLPQHTATAAETWPSRPIRMVHGYGPGSSMDTNARAIAQKLSESLGQPVVVEPRPGATGTIAAELVARSTADGYTLLAFPGSSLAATPHLQKVRFDTVRDFAPIAAIGEFAYLLAAHPAVPANGVKELIAIAKQSPGKISYGSNGTGSSYHLAGELLCMMAGIRMLHVPYKGGGTSAIADLVGGRVDMMWNNPVFLLPQVNAKKLKAIAVTASRRMAAMPHVPTIGETVEGYEMSGYQGIAAPAGTPRDIIDRVNGAVQRALATPELKTTWTTQGMEAPPRSAAQFAEMMRADYSRYGNLIQKLGKVE